MLRVSRVTALTLIAAVALTLGGCTSIDNAGKRTPITGPVAFYPETEEGMDADITGAVRVVDDCFTVVVSDAESYVPVFPADQGSWDGASLTWQGEVFSDGDEIALTGGTVPAEYLGPVTYYPAGCDKDIAFFVAPAA